MSANPSLFRKLSEPFASQDEANESLAGFFKELGDLRERHGIPNVYCIIAGSYLDDGGEHQFINLNKYGDMSLGLELTAFAYGSEKTEHQKNIERMLESGMKSTRRKLKGT